MDGRIQPARASRLYYPWTMSDASEILDTQADLDRAVDRLMSLDRRLKRIVKATGVPPLRRRPAGLRGLARIIVGQQVSTASAEAIWGRLETAFPALTPADILGAADEKLGTIGLSAAKMKSLRHIATEIVEKRLDLNTLAHCSADEAHAKLTALRGVGPWTADVYLLFCLGNADAWPAADGCAATTGATVIAARIASRRRIAPHAAVPEPAERPATHVKVNPDIVSLRNGVCMRFLPM